jgi:hypothetical protein
VEALKRLLLFKITSEGAGKKISAFSVHPSEEEVLLDIDATFTVKQNLRSKALPLRKAEAYAKLKEDLEESLCSTI